MTNRIKEMARDSIEWSRCPLFKFRADINCACRDLFESHGFGDNYDHVVEIHVILRKMLNLRPDVTDYEGDDTGSLAKVKSEVIQLRILLSDFDYQFKGLDELMGLERRDWCNENEA